MEHPIHGSFEDPGMTSVPRDVLLDRPAELQPSLSSNGHADIAQAGARPSVHGKFLFVGDEKLYVKGVTYGAFEPDSGGHEYHDLEVIDRDFTLMVESGINTVRIPHTMPPRSLLDAAENHGLKVMVGLSAEQYAGYLADRKNAPDLERVVREKVAGVAGHPAILCYALGNEIQPPLARWLGRRTIERYLEHLYEAVKDTDPGGLVTYVNYPTTEYLDLPFLDLLAFNVYLESRDRLEAYVARLHSLAGDRPLLMSEVGLDALRNGEDGQAHALDWQIRQTFASGCAGAFVFSWTDEWFRAGEYVEDWAFGLTRPDREPKPALAAMTSAFADVPFPVEGDWPRVSVVVCAFNGGETLRATLQGSIASSTRTSRSSSSTMGRRTTPLRLRRHSRCGSSGLRTGAWVPLETLAPPRLLARSSPISMPTPGPIRTGCITSRTPSIGREAVRLADRTSRRRTRTRLPRASPTRPAGRCTCSSRIPRPSTFPAATSRSGKTCWRN
jgi:hypothetical protein